MRSVTIAGLGLIGGSIGMALRRKGWRVRYVDPAVALEAAQKSGAADERVGTLTDDELVVLATPLDVAVDQLRDVAAPVVTSTCSVMQPLRKIGGANFVAGHPFAGSEKTGLGAARADLFEAKAWFVDRDVPTVRAVIEACGSRPTLIDPESHDLTLALTSHLPQVVSTALASLMEQKGIDPVFIGSGVRTLLRLAGSSHEVWGPVLDANQENVSRAAAELKRVIETLSPEDFDRARELYSRLNGKG